MRRPSKETQRGGLGRRPGEEALGGGPRRCCEAPFPRLTIGAHGATAHRSHHLPFYLKDCIYLCVSV